MSKGSFVNFQTETDPAVESILTKSDQKAETGRIDPSVNSLLAKSDERRALAQLPLKKRKQKIKEKAKTQARLKGRVNLDLPPSLKMRLFELAEEHEITASQLSTLLLLKGLGLLEAGQVDVDLYKVSTKSPRYGFKLDLQRALETALPSKPFAKKKEKDAAGSNDKRNGFVTF
ncbi:MAG: hypothetical protein BroJett011_42340 [Chloroflexota bacterium]|nr:MAG: hypothetical protein BroJett011_42340 [Chloroflexota bacterium]